MISVILPIFNEQKSAYFKPILNQFKDDPFFDLIVIDGGSTDGTLEILDSYALRTTILKDSSRATRINEGVRQAQHEIILLLHPRTLISDEGIGYLKNHAKKIEWAGFTHQFDHPHWFLRYISWYSNNVRLKKKKIVYLDHCVIFKKHCLKGQTLPDIPIFEDTVLSNILNKHYTPERLPFIAKTSAIRFLHRGIFRQFLLNQFIKCLHHRGYDHTKINWLYERKLNLNQEN